MKVGDLVKFISGTGTTPARDGEWKTGIVVKTWRTPYKSRVQSVDIMIAEGRIIPRLFSAVEVINEDR